MSMQLKDAAPGSVVMMVDHIVAKQVIREIWYERLPDNETSRRVRTADGAIRYPVNVPIRRVRVLQYEVNGPDVDVRWDTGYLDDAAIWECDGRITVQDIMLTRGPPS